ncbi:hypothetical protein JTE90_019238 [Oedothorax gibbosus]|uniref:Uncharacterized protein n=1 Tax=Oedothorax gibbosus TaxID=931172 RepID=A0AAV6UTR7_9ARAC|nr:hypothetical protein JTE90_019238 [Oedothorax gibbosus]
MTFPDFSPAVQGMPFPNILKHPGLAKNMAESAATLQESSKAQKKRDPILSCLVHACAHPITCTFHFTEFRGLKKKRSSGPSPFLLIPRECGRGTPSWAPTRRDI